MRKLLTLIATMIIFDAYGEAVGWYVPNQSYTVSTCTANGNITPPTTTPTKSGYRFIGWKEQSLNYAATDRTPSAAVTSGSYPTSWTATFYTPGSLSTKVTGNWFCSSYVGNCNGNTRPTVGGANTDFASCTKLAASQNMSAEGSNCWCQIKQMGSIKNLDSVLPKIFIFEIFNDKTTCKQYCAYYCAGLFYNGNSYAMAAMLGV